ncbi:MAG TPA: adenylate/guanylate cyclase domain-containing protein [Gammaproteobacteria bacterium]|nr:adenylate/guanylate cyclase domain-containing protein [Gammaproteobacteria bacterium]
MLNFIKKTRRLYVDILIVFVTLFVITAGVIIGYMQYTQYQHSLTFSKKIVQQNGDIIASEINDYIKPAQVTELVAHLFHNGTLSFKNKQYLTTFMEGVLRAYPYMSAIYMVDNQGNFVNEIRATNKPYSRPEIQNKPPNTKFITYLLNRPIDNKTTSTITGSWIYKDADGNIVGTNNLNAADNYNPYNRPWYLGAQNAASKYWLEVYRFYSSSTLGLTVSYSVYDQNKRLAGVIATDFDIDALSNFLKERKLVKNAISFIVTNKNELIAYSNFNAIEDEKNNTQLLNIRDIKNSPISSAYQYFLDHKQNTFLFSYQGINYLAYLKDFSYQDNKSWTIGLLAPLDDFMNPVKKAKTFALLFSLMVLTIGIILIIIVSRNISKPIVYLAKEMDKIKDLQLEHKAYFKTHITENQTMINALNAMRTSLKSFSAYVPKELVAQLITRGEIATLGFERRELTVLFTDITGFSSISEKISPEELTSLLALYFKILTETIKSEFGTIDKYTGDGLMAIWGAPATDPEHIINACRAALACQKKVLELNKFWQMQKKPVFNTRMGLDTGNTLIGNLGSLERMNYTAVGDVVNLASHLEMLNKQYNTSIIVSEHIYIHSQHKFIFRSLGKTSVKGGTHTLNIYELIAEKVGDYDNAANPYQQSNTERAETSQHER